MRIKMTVIIDLTQPASKAEIRDYVRQAVKEYGGDLHPSSPFFSTKLRVMPGKIETVRKLVK